MADKFKSLGRMLAKATLGAAIPIVATWLTSTDLGPWTPVAIVAAQLLVHAADKFGLSQLSVSK